ncbi:MAG: hypothetical protein KDK78_06820, partial [Chlamydiia bacterium]|nr:hypothetical protein [Chlamydiia bacterium]
LLVASTQQEHLNASSEERSEVNARIYSTFKDILRASNESLCGYASALTFEGRQCLEKDLLELAPPAQTIITRFFEQVGKRVAEEEFAQRLSLWAEEASDAEEDRATAAKRILAAYNTKASTLCLRRLKLSSLPLELVELTDLNTLDLSHNHIRTFPLFLNQLPQLGGLLLSNNRIEILPDEISSLSALDLLNLAHNEISYIPDSIGMLRQLESLDLAFNRLSTLPATMGEMQQLRSLFLRDNGGLSELPFTCDHLARMTDIDAQGTGVTTPSQVALNLAMALGDLYWDAAEDTDLTLPQLGFLLAFDEREAFLIKDWLQRLSATVDYEQCPAPLALRTCQMLASLESSAPFREAFFAQVMSNNRRCSDRSSMAFNELYTAWRIACLPVEASVEEKLDILAAIARTVTLRNAITNIFDAIGENPEESVETFLLF